MQENILIPLVNAWSFIKQEDPFKYPSCEHKTQLHFAFHESKLLFKITCFFRTTSDSSGALSLAWYTSQGIVRMHSGYYEVAIRNALQQLGVPFHIGWPFGKPWLSQVPFLSTLHSRDNQFEHSQLLSLLYFLGRKCDPWGARTHSLWGTWRE